MRKIFFILLFVTLISTPSFGASLKGGFTACISEDLHSQIVSAAVKKDERAWNYLLKNGCIVTKGGIPISVLDTTWTGTAKVRAYLGDTAIILWTPIENVVR